MQQTPGNGREGGKGAGCSPVSAGRAASLRILLVEDHTVNRIVVTRFLAKRHCCVVAVGKGREVVERLAREPASFDLVLMDIQMPEMDGLAATAAIRRAEATTGRHLPIVAMTAGVLDGDCERCLAAGMDGYVLKPIRAETLFAEIDRVVGRIPELSKPLCEPLADSLQTIDRAVLLERVEGDVTLLAEMVQIFEQDGGHLVTAIGEAVRAGDARALERAAHTLKGMVSNFTATAATEAAARLEEMGRAQTLEKSADAFQLLQHEVDALRPLLYELRVEVAT